MKLYVKIWCSWCVRARDWLKSRGYTFQEIDVLADAAAYDEMRRISGRSLTPVLEVDGRVLADFGPPELEEFIERNGIKP